VTLVEEKVVASLLLEECRGGDDAEET